MLNHFDKNEENSDWFCEFWYDPFLIKCILIAKWSGKESCRFQLGFVLINFVVTSSIFVRAAAQRDIFVPLKKLFVFQSKHYEI